MKLLLYGCVTGVEVNTVEELKPLMDEVSRRCRFTVRCSHYEQFEPRGCTGCHVLQESHFNTHSYPEHSKLFVDVFCCASQWDMDAALTCAAIVEEVFGATGGAWKTDERDPAR